eukprot:5419360-Lingulodinium_polyedra.AAC.1
MRPAPRLPTARRPPSWGGSPLRPCARPPPRRASTAAPRAHSPRPAPRCTKSRPQCCPKGAGPPAVA